MFLPGLPSKYKVLTYKIWRCQVSQYSTRPAEVNFLAVKPQFSVSAKWPKDRIKYNSLPVTLRTKSSSYYWVKLLWFFKLYFIDITDIITDVSPNLLLFHPLYPRRKTLILVSLSMSEYFHENPPIWIQLFSYFGGMWDLGRPIVVTIDSHL